MAKMAGLHAEGVSDLHSYAVGFRDGHEHALETVKLAKETHLEQNLFHFLQEEGCQVCAWFNAVTTHLLAAQDE